MNSHLIARRKAAHTLNELVKSLNLGAMAEKFDPEDNTWWDVQGDNLVMVKRGKTIIAIIELHEGSKRHLTIPSWFGLIRTEHLSDFNPAHYGLLENNSEDVLFNEKLPDSEGFADFGDPPGLDLPHRPIEKKTRYRQPTVVM